MTLGRNSMMTNTLKLRDAGAAVAVKVSRRQRLLRRRKRNSTKVHSAAPSSEARTATRAPAAKPETAAPAGG